MEKTVKERLAIVEQHLDRQGVKDIKFYLDFSPDTSAEKVAAEVAEVLEAEMAGRFKKVDSFKELLAS